MNKFFYEKKPHTIEAYGKTYEIPTKTADVIDKLNAAGSAISSAKTTVDVVKATKDGIAVFIGVGEADRLFPDSELNSIDTDEISAFWMFLKNESNRATMEILKRYSPNPVIKK